MTDFSTRPVRDADAPPRVAADEPLAASSAVQRIWVEQARRDRWQWWAYAVGTLALCLIVVAWALREEFLPKLNPQRTLDVYTPGLHIGRAVPVASLAAYDFAHASPQGYEHARAKLRDGLTLDRVWLAGESPRGTRTPTTGTIEDVELSTDDPRGAAHVEVRLRETLGRPLVRCRPTGERIVSWDAGGRGGTRLTFAPASVPFHATLESGESTAPPSERRTHSCR